VSTEENKQTVRTFIERLFVQRDLGLLDETEAADAVTHATPSGTYMSNRESVKETLKTLFAAFPDLRISVLDLIAENDKVVLRGTWVGTQAGEYLGIPPMGRHVTVPTVHVLRLRDGKIVEHWFAHDSLGVVQQLGGRITV
jgi:steroid delta-isomerase-like uncharacterized protein